MTVTHGCSFKIGMSVLLVTFGGISCRSGSIEGPKKNKDNGFVFQDADVQNLVTIVVSPDMYTEISAPGGHLSVTIPDGALSAPTDITIGQLTNDAAPKGAVGPVYVLGPAGLEFLKPVRLNFSAKDLGEAVVENIRPVHFDTGQTSFAVLSNWSHVQESSEHTWAGDTQHFSAFGLSDGTGSKLANDSEPVPTCTSAGDSFCSEAAFCANNGACVIQIADGNQGCDRDRMCASGNCVGNACCPSACTACHGLTCLYSCGNQEIDDGEECDQGLGNGVACVPPVDDTCQYCDANCQWAEVVYIPACAAEEVVNQCMCGTTVVSNKYCCDGVPSNSACVLTTLRLDAGLESGISVYDGKIFYPLLSYKTAGVAHNDSEALNSNIAIANTEFDRFYQNETWVDGSPGSSATFTFKVNNGTYSVYLHFAELNAVEPQIPGDRVFYLDIQGERQESPVDIIKAVGKYAALVKSFDVTVTDENLVLTLTNEAFYAEIVGIEILPQGQLPLATTNPSACLNNQAVINGCVCGDTWVSSNYCCNNTPEITSCGGSGSSNKDITKFAILGVDGIIRPTTISLTLPYGTLLNNLTPTIEHTGISVSPATLVAQNFTSPKDYTVTAEDLSTKVYTITVTAYQTPVVTYYVSIGGSDVSGNGTTTPWASLAWACANVQDANSIIHINTGTYYETSPCNLNEGVSIEGEGESNSIIVSDYADDFTISLYSNSAGANGNQHISDIKMDGDGLTAYGAIHVYNRSNVEIHHCAFVNFFMYGVGFDGGG